MRTHFNMDTDWRFHNGDYIEDAETSHTAVYNSVKTGNLKGPATKRAFDDEGWERVDLPHDYIREAAFSADSPKNHGCRVKTNGWYRKTFTVDSKHAGKHALLVFDGISTSSVVYLNGSIVARSFSGYYEIVADVTDRLYYDRINTLAVYTKGDENEGWWYEGAGIYRHAHLYIKEPLHIAHNGLWAKPVLLNAAKNLWKVELEVTLENSAFDTAGGILRATLYDQDTAISTTVGEADCAPDSKTAHMLTLAVNTPRRWDVDDPYLYTLKVELLQGGEVIDTEQTRIGFRTVRMDAEKGFFLNGKPLKLKGACNHQDHAGIGVAVPDSVQYFRIRCLKEMGLNAYRCAHNPPAKEILDACDEYGMLVMDENRTFETRPDAIQNLENLIRRDRNHPSVILYSLFNEEPLQNSEEGRKIFARLKSAVKRLDDTRPVMGAVNDAFHPGGTGEEMDVLGLNYTLRRIDESRKAFPNKPIFGSENNSAVATRDCTESDREGAHVLADCDKELVPWGAGARGNWRVVMERNDFAGSFIWTGFDYRGEPTPFDWPSCSSQFGVMDTCGFPKNAYYFHQAMYISTPMLHIFPHWNWEEGKSVCVTTVTNCDEVELLLNGRSLGRRPSNVFEQNEWEVTFEAGTLSAVGYRNGQAAVTAERKTAGTPVAVKLTPDRTVLENGGQDTVPVRVSAVDANGVEVPLADHLIRFTVEGDGFVRGVGNGDPNSHEAEHLPVRHLFNGLCQVLVTAKLGAKAIKLIAESDGFAAAEVVFEIKDTPAPNYMPTKPNRAITGVLVSVANQTEKPDPTKVYGDDDMNSFAPIVLDSAFNNFLPSRFCEGWREFRIPISLPATIPAGKAPAIAINSILCERAEFYVNGKQILGVQPEYKASLTVPLPLDQGSSFEVRALLKAIEGSTSSNGFSQGISLSFADA